MTKPDPMPPLTWARIELKALAHNYRELRRVTASRSRIMAVVKADAYGHGAVRVSEVALANGVEYLAVARISEALALRQAGIEAPILLFGHALPDYVPYMAANHIRASVDDLDMAQRLSEAAQRARVQLPIHVKFDTGMGRLGLPVAAGATAGDLKSMLARTVAAVVDMARLPGLTLEGLYTHFAGADGRDKADARGQFDLFMDIVQQLRRNGIEPPLCHAANCAAIIGMPETHLDLVRPGICQYGLRPSADVDMNGLALRPVMALMSTVIHVKDVPAGFNISYGSTYQTSAPTRIATVAIGYADGLSRLLSSRGALLVHGQRAPIVGRVCMDLTVIDVGHIEGVRVGDEVVAMGRQGAEEISADEIADLAGTINYEVVSSINARVQRVYI